MLTGVEPTATPVSVSIDHRASVNPLETNCVLFLFLDPTSADFCDLLVTGAYGYVAFCLPWDVHFSYDLFLFAADCTTS